MACEYCGVTELNGIHAQGCPRGAEKVIIVAKGTRGQENQDNGRFFFWIRGTDRWISTDYPSVDEWKEEIAKELEPIANALAATDDDVALCIAGVLYVAGITLLLDDAGQARRLYNAVMLLKK